jgi:hypothetical protein
LFGTACFLYEEAMPSSHCRGFLWFCLAAALMLAAPACKNGSSLPLARLTEARRVATELRLAFRQAADASNRAVMADTDETSVAFATEAEQAKKTARSDVDAIRPLLRDLGYDDETRALDDFERRFAEYDALDRSVLELAVENTNLKAQRLSFGPIRDDARAFRTALDVVAKAAKPSARCPIASAVASAEIAVADIQVLDAPHIAEADDAEMTRLEHEMDALGASARGALGALSALVDPTSQPDVAAATAALDRFEATQAKLVALSRRNSNVRSQALSLGKMLALSGACDAGLAALTDALAKRGFTATR